ncbi:uncharacterized protein A4U43_C06F3850 [Asparagus officinalis]|uniref:Uncharacterized protein n=1 Tax=Asparagus officinalis TaxID=4686 RepID=A0A5P1EPV5_ASPOF|nr:uncharacterized protein A4U43_C06F3850 [Asparagus officinalis]
MRRGLKSGPERTLPDFRLPWGMSRELSSVWRYAVPHQAMPKTIFGRFVQSKAARTLNLTVKHIQRAPLGYVLKDEQLLPLGPPYNDKQEEAKHSHASSSRTSPYPFRPYSSPSPPLLGHYHHRVQTESDRMGPVSSLFDKSGNVSGGISNGVIPPENQ